ncbi:MAG: DNA polymerase III subunit beta [Candidatus Nomurabacteria bacterium]
MKFECKGAALVTAVQQVAKARSKQSNQNYLQDIHLSLEDHQLSLRATNLELFCEKSISVKGIQNGNCILQGETIVKIIPFLQKNDTIFSCELIDGVFSITSDKEVIEIKVTPYEDFPTLPPQGKHIGRISKDILSVLLKEVSFCAATTEIKPEIASVYLYTKDNNIISVATDSYRLAEKVLESPSSMSLNVLIPQKHIADILYIIGEEEEELELSLYESILTITTSRIALCIHTVTGQFPDYRQLFPKSFTTVATLNKDDIQKSLTLTTFFTEQYSQVKCVFTDTSLTLHSKNESVGQVTNSISIKKTGDDIEVSYNNRYFLDVLSHIVGNVLICSFTVPQKPLFIQSKEDITFTYLLMPLNR